MRVMAGRDPADQTKSNLAQLFNQAKRAPTTHNFIPFHNGSVWTNDINNSVLLAKIEIESQL